jgi:hypothetical protein
MKGNGMIYSGTEHEKCPTLVEMLKNVFGFSK